MLRLSVPKQHLGGGRRRSLRCGAAAALPCPPHESPAQLPPTGAAVPAALGAFMAQPRRARVGRAGAPQPGEPSPGPPQRQPRPPAGTGRAAPGRSAGPEGRAWLRARCEGPGGPGRDGRSNTRAIPAVLGLSPGIWAVI